MSSDAEKMLLWDHLSLVGYCKLSELTVVTALVINLILEKLHMEQNQMKMK